MPSISPVTKSAGREWREPWLPKGVRRVGRGRSFQQRHYVGSCKKGIYPINLGSYASEYESNRIGKLFRKLWVSGMSPWEALTSLIASGDISPRICARWVYPVPGGWAIWARCRGLEINLPGPFVDAAAARKAADAVFKQTAPAA